jgi:hypothetical protein
MDAMRWIYLSPHLDDAALSAGGLIYEQTQAGIQVEIWTFIHRLRNYCIPNGASPMQAKPSASAARKI